MRTLRAWIIRFANLFAKDVQEREFVAELESHLELHIADNLRQGMTPQEARRSALIKLGGVAQTEERYRDRRSLPLLETLLQDLRFASRMLRKNPGFTAVAVLVMALGIGANAAMFSVVNAVLLRPLSFNDPDRIVTLSTLWKDNGHHGQVSAPDYRDWHDQSTAFEAMADYYHVDTAVTAGAAAEYAHVAGVSNEFFTVFQLQPTAGRAFSPEEVKPGAAGAVMISHAFAVTHFGGPANALGKSLRTAGRTLPIVGVLPADFHFPERTDIWFPVNTTSDAWGTGAAIEEASRSAHNYRVVGRLKPGVTLEQAQAQMTAIGARLEEKYPDSNAGKSVAVTRMRDEMVSNFRLTLWVMLAAVGIVLLIACANLANMLLAKAVGRSREIAVRAALGAGRSRIVRQLITESLALALLAGAAGLLLAFWGARVLVALAPADVPRLSETSVDARVLVFALAVSLLASLLFGLAPALQVLRVDLNKSLKLGTARASGGVVADRLRGALVVAEIALSMMLLVAGGLLLKSFVALQNVSLGFRPEHILVMETSVPASGDLESQKRAARFYQELLAEAARVPGVLNAGASMAVPGRSASNGGYWVDYLPKDLSVTAPQAVFSVVTPGTFATVGVPLLEGRDFEDRDAHEAPFSAIINEKLAKEAFPGQDPLGHRIFCGLDSLAPMTIVGVVGDARQDGPAKPPSPEIFMAYRQHPSYSTALNVLVRSALEPGALSETLRQKAQALSPDVPVKFTSVEASLSEDVAAPRFRTLLLGLFAALAVCLAMAGVYGVMSYVVGQKSNEIGLRMALGASPVDVLCLVLRQALGLAGAGILLGLLCAAGVTRLLQSMLFSVKASDPLTYLLVVVVVAMVALAATYIPARRAMRVDPMVTLRYE